MGTDDKKEVRPPMNKDEQIDHTLLVDAMEAGCCITTCEHLVHVTGLVGEKVVLFRTEELARFDQLRQARSTIDAELVRDAERYRWLRDNNGIENSFAVEVFIEGESYAPGHLDAQIDTALAKNKGKD